MAFSFFTKRSIYASTRLRFVGRGMQVFGMLSFVLSVTMVYRMRSLPIPAIQDRFDAILKTAIIFSGLRMLSYVFIGRALLRREKWGAYAAVAALGIPATIQLFWPSRHDPFQTISLIAAFTTLSLIATVKNELGTVLDSELAEHGKPPKPVEPFTPRNRGFGEPHDGSPSLAGKSTRALEIIGVQTPMRAATADPEAIVRRVPPA